MALGPIRVTISDWPDTGSANWRLDYRNDSYTWTFENGDKIRPCAFYVGCIGTWTVSGPPL
jgi:hypothetical protein